MTYDVIKTHAFTLFALTGLFLNPLLMSASAAEFQDNVVISEFMASNSRTLADEDGDYSDWIELSNVGTNTVNLAGWRLTDDQSNLDKWEFPATNINAGGFLVVFASNKDRRVPGRPLHTNFRLNNDGEYLALVRPDGTNIVSQFAPFPKQAPNVSYGFGPLTTNRTIIATNAPLLVRIPTADDALAWVNIDYADSVWIQGTNGVGYGTTNVTQADYGAAVAPTAPVGYWRFSESSGTTAINSGSGAGLNGVYSNATVATAGPRPPQYNGFEPDNNAPTFNGSSGYVVVNNSLLNNRGAFTIGGWIKPAVTPGSRIGLFGQNDCVEFGFISGTTLEVWTPSGGSLDVAYPYPVNAWHHVVAVGNGSNLRIFVDGALIGTGGSSTANYGSSAFLFSIGGGGIFDNTGNFFNGQIDEVVCYHRALTTNEILALYQGGTNAVGVSVLPFVNTDAGPVMSNINASAQMRIPFVIDDPSQVALLTLRMRYDDGFVAFLNGAEVVRANAPASLAYNSAATNSHSALGLNEYRVGTGNLVAGTNLLAIQGLNASASDTDFLIQAELIAANIAAISSVPVYFTTPTPGQPNATGVPVPGPAILNPAHSPNVPRDDQDLLVNAQAVPTFYPVASVVLRYQIMFGPEIEVQMFDDGAHGDAAPGDGIFGGTIPASASTNGQMIRWYFHATDTQGNLSRWPLFADPANSPQFLGTIVDPTNVTSTLPIIHLFVDPNQQSAVDSQAGGRASVFHDGEFYDNVQMQVRGNTTAGYPKKSHRIEFNSEHELRYVLPPTLPAVGDWVSGKPSPGGRIRKTSFEADYPDPSYLRQGMSFWLCEQIGCPSSFYIPVRLQLNSQFYQLAHQNDVHGEELLDRLGYDPNGALYNAAGTIQASGFSTGVLEKKTRKWEGNADYVALANAIVETLPVGTRKTNIFDMLDLPTVINYLVAARFVQENDDAWANMSLYHDNDGDNLWRIVPFDMNLSWGAFYYDNAANDTGIQATNDNHKSFPLYGSSQALSLSSANFNRIYDVIFTVPETRQMFLTRMRTLLDTYIGSPGVPTGATPAEQALANWRDLIATEALNDRAKWGWPNIGGQNNLPPGTNIFFGVSDLLQQFFYPRRQHFLTKHSVTNTALAIGISKTQNAGIPLPPPGALALRIAGVEFNPASSNQAQEYIVLTNPYPAAIDISGWKIDGAVQFTFKPGTVVPSNSVVYLSPDVVAFRARTTGPRRGQGQFILGNYKGQLSARGESLLLSDNYGRPLHSFTYPGNSSPAQLYLRVTEIMYHPPGPRGFELQTNSGEFEYVELKNIGPTNINLIGVHFTNGIQFSFTGSAITSLAPQQTVLVVKNLAAFTSRYGSGLPVAGQYVGSLENHGEPIRIDDATGEKILEFTFDNNWYPITDGLGFSLVIRDPSAPWNTWSDKPSWRPNGPTGTGAQFGSPGADDTAPSIPPVLINEALTRSDVPPPTDTIELYNPTSNQVNVGGWFLTDDFNTPKKFRIPDDTTIAAGGYLVFDESRFNPNPGVPPSFALGSDGDEVYLFSGDARTNLTGYVHGFGFGAADNGVPFGRYVTSIGEEHFVAQISPSFGATNPGPKVGPVVITEIMYHPADASGSDNSGDEFVELLNVSETAVGLVDLFDASGHTWQIKGGIDFVFPPNITLVPGAYLLLVNFNPSDPAAAAAFRTKYQVPDEVPLFGPYQGKLDNSADSIELKKPTTATGGETPYVLVDKVSYRDSAPWPPGADGYGLSLQRKAPSEYGNDPSNWLAALPTAGAPRATTGAAPQILQQPQSQIVLVGTNATLSVSVSGTEPLQFQWRQNGANLLGATNISLQLPNVQPKNFGDYQVLVYNASGSELSATARLNVLFPVTLITPPENRIVRSTNINAVISNVTFSVFAASSGNVRYQWRGNGMDIPNATNSSYILPPVSIANHGSTYQVVISDELSSITTDPVTLSVLILPTFVQILPARLTVVQGEGVSLSVAISGFPAPFNYAWSRLPTLLTNSYTSSTNSTLVLSNLQAGSGTYRVIVTNAANAGTNFAANTVCVVIALTDTNANSLPDIWEGQYGVSDPNDDPDHDGMTNLQEWRAGTDPTNALSVLKIDSLVVSNQTVLRFGAMSNKTYAVDYKPSVDDANWIVLTNIASRTTNRTAVVVTDALAPTNRFYRVRTFYP